MTDIENREGRRDFDVSWPWRQRRLDPGLTAVLRVRNEARNLQWVLPPILHAVDAVVLVDNLSDDGTAEVADRVAREVGMRERLTVLSYPFEVSRCGPEHLATPPDSVHSLAYFCNWSFSHVRTTHSMKWDGDMVLTAEGVALFDDLTWQLPGHDALVVAPFHPISIESDRVAFIDLGLRHREPWIYPMSPECIFHKAFEWEIRSEPRNTTRLELPEGLCMELKWLDVDEFDHWTNTEAFQTVRTPRKQREWAVFQAASSGRWSDVDRLVRVEAPLGTHIVDHVAGTWLPQARRPLAG